MRNISFILAPPAPPAPQTFHIQYPLLEFQTNHSNPGNLHTLQGFFPAGVFIGFRGSFHGI